MKRILLCIALLIATSVAAQEPVATGSASCRGGAGTIPQIGQHAGYILAFLRVDELGQRMHCDTITEILDNVRNRPDKHRGPLVITLIHGWKHDAQADDTFVRSFRELLEDLVRSDGRSRDVVGIYVRWPANDGAALGPLQNLKFWETRARADRVANGREISRLLTHLNARVPQVDGVMVTIGHSFGARILYDSVAPTLINNVVRDGAALNGNFACRGNRVCRSVPGYGDLIVMLNPAIEAAQYTTIAGFGGGHWADKLPTGTRVYDNVEAWPHAQSTIMLTLGAKNDSATTTAWGIAHFGSSDPILTTTITNHRPYFTHELVYSPGINNAPLHPAVAPRPLDERLSSIMDRTQPFSFSPQTRLVPVGARSNSPFIVAQADKEIIDGHSGVWSPVFRQFLSNYISLMAEARRLSGSRERENFNEFHSD